MANSSFLCEVSKDATTNADRSSARPADRSIVGASGTLSAVAEKGIEKDAGRFDGLGLAYDDLFHGELLLSLQSLPKSQLPARETASLHRPVSRPGSSKRLLWSCQGPAAKKVLLLSHLVWKAGCVTAGASAEPVAGLASISTRDTGLSHFPRSLWMQRRTLPGLLNGHEGKTFRAHVLYKDASCVPEEHVPHARRGERLL
jgi:hypothetical protein